MKEIVNGNPQLRRTLYTAYAIVGLVLGATQVGFSAAEVGQPIALTVALAVYGFLGTAFGFTARANTGAQPATGHVEGR